VREVSDEQKDERRRRRLKLPVGDVDLSSIEESLDLDVERSLDEMS